MTKYVISYKENDEIKRYEITLNTQEEVDKFLTYFKDPLFRALFLIGKENATEMQLELGSIPTGLDITCRLSAVK